MSGSRGPLYGLGRFRKGWLKVGSMRTFAAAAMALAVLAGPAAAQTGDRSFDGSYTVVARGLDAGEFNYSFRQTGQAYTITATREMHGLAAAALGRNQDYTYSVQGVVAADGSLRPTVYQHQGGRRREDRPNGRLIRATFTASDVVTTAVPGPPNMGDPPATAEQRRGTI